MGTAIHEIHLGFDTAYILKDKGTIMIDSGEPKKEKHFLKALKSLSIAPEEIKLIVLTHGHWDHIGSASEIKKLTGAKIAMHKNDKHLLEDASNPKMPPGVTTWGKVTSNMLTWLLMPFVHINSDSVDIVLDDSAFSLEKFGIPGIIVHTPGHSSGSVSVLLESGEAFVGDAAMNKIPLRRTPGLPVFADDWPTLIASWKMLSKKAIKTIYPAHGNSFSFEIMKEELDNTKIV
jgi:hydroxyacylglutathione hydrolase